MRVPRIGNRVSHPLGPPALAFGSFGFFWGIWALSTADIEDELGISHSGLGAMVAVGLVGAIIAIIMGGPLAERFGASRALSAWLAAWGISLLALSAASNIASFLPLYIVAVTTGAGVDVTMNVAATAGLSDRPAALMRFHALFNLGGIVGGALTATIIHAGMTWRLALVPLGVIVLVGAPWARRVDLPAGAPGERHAMLHSVKELASAGLILVGVVAALGAMVDGGIETFGVLFLRTNLKTGVLVGGAAYVVGHMLAGSARYGLAPLATRPKGLRPVAIGLFVASCGLALELGVSSPPVAALGLAIAAIGATVVWPVLFAYVGARSDRPAVAVSGITAVGYLGFLVGPVLVGTVSDARGLRWGLGVLAVTAFCGAVLAIAIGRPSRQLVD